MVSRAYWNGFLRLSAVPWPIRLFPATNTGNKINFDTSDPARHRKADEHADEEVQSDHIIENAEVVTHRDTKISENEPDLIAPESVNAATPTALHAELCTAIDDLAKSVDVAVMRMRLRAKCTVAIADTVKVTRAAEALRAAAIAGAKREEVSLAPEAPAVEGSLDRAPGEAYLDAVNELSTTCNRQSATKIQRAQRNESKIAQRVLELHDRLGGLI
jgi:hypothetical protein